MKEMQFATKAEAFAYMLRYQLEEKKVDPMVAAEKANEFANIFAQNMGIPEKTAPKPEGVDKYIQMADKVVCYCEEHPKIVEFITGAATFFVGLVTGKKLEQTADNASPSEIAPVNFDELN